MARGDKRGEGEGRVMPLPADGCCTPATDNRGEGWRMEGDMHCDAALSETAFSRSLLAEWSRAEVRGQRAKDMARDEVVVSE